VCERLAFGLMVSVRQSLGSDWNATVTRASIASIESTEKNTGSGEAEHRAAVCIAVCLCSRKHQIFTAWITVFVEFLVVLGLLFTVGSMFACLCIN